MTVPVTTQSDPYARRRWAGHVWWIALLSGLAVFAYVWLQTPHGREDNTAWLFVVKLFPFLCLSAAIAFFPVGAKRLYLLLCVPFIFFTGYLLPRISYFYYGDVDRAQGDSFYTHLYLLLYPGIVLTVEQKTWGPNYIQLGVVLSEDFDGDNAWDIGVSYLRTGINERAGEIRFGSFALDE